MERRTIVLAESPQESIKPLVESNSLPKLKRLLQRFGNREREEARLRVQVESLWTANRLKEHMRVELSVEKLYLVSNREPYMHVKD